MGTWGGGEGRGVGHCRISAALRQLHSATTLGRSPADVCNTNSKALQSAHCSVRAYVRVRTIHDGGAH
eukprot:2878667-Prymnesium_polylepis.1